ncbi:MAG: hypothetical protein AAFY28_10415 [Actinomycetota bacterium]
MTSTVPLTAPPSPTGLGMRAVGQVITIGALAAWAVWLAWRMATLTTAVGAAVLAVELVAIAAATAMTVGLCQSQCPSAPSQSRHDAGAPRPRAATGRIRAWLGDVDEGDAARAACADVAAALRHAPDEQQPPAGAELVRTVVATDGLRRAVFVAAVVAILLSGRVPFEVPPRWAVLALAAGWVALPVGHWMLSGRTIRPTDRFVWSLATIGAGLGRSRSTAVVPARWTAAMATVVVLNLAVALRGVSDRWTHGLDAMPRDARVAAMVVALTVAAGALVSLRTLPRPDVGTFGATGRLDELSTRRWALGATGAVAVLGLVLGALPAGVGT